MSRKSKKKKMKRSLDAKKHSPQTVKRFKCSHCAYRTDIQGNLNKHIKSRHTDPSKIQWFPCGQCEYKAKQKGGLNKHMLRHTDPSKIQWFPCNQCGYKAKQKDYLDRHIKRRHTDPSKIQWFPCPHCNSYKAKEKSDLKQHITNVHYGGDRERKGEPRDQFGLPILEGKHEDFSEYLKRKAKEAKENPDALPPHGSVLSVLSPALCKLSLVYAEEVTRIDPRDIDIGSWISALRIKERDLICAWPTQQGIQNLVKDGPRWQDATKSSVDEVDWLMYMEDVLSVRMIRNHHDSFVNNQQTVLGVDVDGFAEKDGEGIVFEYAGCHWHGGCFFCAGPLNERNKEQQAKREEDLKRYHSFLEAGYRVIVCTSCEWKMYYIRQTFYLKRKLVIARELCIDPNNKHRIKICYVKP